jgi:SAM-dependent methyltransferase
MPATASSQPVLHNPNLHTLVWELLKPFPPGKLLDLPSGPGYFVQNAQKNGFGCIAGEIDPALHVFPDVHYEKVDMAARLPFADGTFDYLVSIEGVEHVENQYLFLRECARVLKPTGRLFLTTPNASSLQNRLLFFLTGAHDNPPGPFPEDLPSTFMTHINLLPFQRLESFLRYSGFQIDRLHPYKLRPVSQALYPLVYPLALLRYKKAFKKHYSKKPDAAYYWSLFERYLSKEVMCGEYNVVVASKRSASGKNGADERTSHH